jgi:hypothetical protein
MNRAARMRRPGRTWVWLLVGLLIGGATGAGTMYVLKRGKAGMPGGPRLDKADELAMVPGDAVAFVHARVREAWKADDMIDLRRVIDKAGPQALKVLDEGFVPAPSTLDRATLVLLNNPEAGARDTGGPPPPVSVPNDVHALVILRFTDKFDRDQVKSTYLKGGSAKTENGKEYFVDQQAQFGMYFPNDQVMVLGMAAGFPEFLRKQPADGKAPAGRLARPLALASEGTRHFVAAVNTNLFRINPGVILNNLRDAPPEVRQLATDAAPILKAEAFAIAFGMAGEDSRLDVRAYYKNDEDAEAAEAGVRAAAASGRKAIAEFKTKLDKKLAGPDGQKKPRPVEQLPGALLAYAGIGGLNTLDEILANPPLKRDGSEVVLSADRTTLMNAVYGGYAAVFGALLDDGVFKVREAAARMQGSNNLKMIGIAMHNYHDVTGAFPPPDGKLRPNDKGGLSWRVHILPYIEEDNLYKQFKLDEPWDSEHNKKLVERMPKTYVSPLAPAPGGQTYYKVFSGKDAIFFPGSRTRLTDITDGSSNTIMTVEGGQPVEWTKPDDIPFTGKFDPKTLPLPGKTGFNVGMADGSVRWLNADSLTPEMFGALITRAGGEVVNIDGGPGAAVPRGPGDPFAFPKGPGEAFPVPKGPLPKGGGVAPPPIKD